MIVVLLDLTDAVGKPALASHRTGPWAAQRRHPGVIGTARQASALSRPSSHASKVLPRLVLGVGLFGDILLSHAPDLARVVIDGPHIACALASHLRTTNLILVPEQPSPCGDRASAKMLNLLEKASISRLWLVVRFVFNHHAPHTEATRTTVDDIARLDPPLLSSCNYLRVIFATAPPTGRLSLRYRRRKRQGSRDQRARPRRRWVGPITERSSKRAFAPCPGDPDFRVQAPGPSDNRRRTPSLPR